MPDGPLSEGIVPYLVIAAGAILGANARYLVTLQVAERFGAALPYGTLLINVSGSLLIGYFLTTLAQRAGIDPLWRLFFATGFLGAYTTFSAYSWETAQLIREGAILPALLYLIGSVLASMLAVFLGILAAENLP